ncbi:MAG: alpha/beta fold hydrolase [Oscillatoriales cyanobacterium SM2_2_1]|nr:alpha/beta fold hydrolase [Oscillatoriales cyanobacterium SM2_2_1]
MTQIATAAEPSFQGEYWLWRSQKIYYVHAGSNPQRPPLLLIHGFGASTDHWRKNIAELSQHFEVWAIDLLGFGRSQKPNWQYNGDLWRDQIHEFITAKIQRPTVLAGNSLGGYGALCTAGDRPESVAGVILLNSAGAFSDTTPLGSQSVNPLQKLLRDGIQALLKQSWANRLLFESVRRKSRIRRTLLQVYTNKAAVTDRLVEEIYAPSCDPGAPQVFATIFTTRQGKTVDQLLKTMTCPLLVIWGQNDPWMNAPSRSAKFREHYPGLTEHFLDAGHCPHDDRPDLVNPVIQNWLMAL